MPDPIHNWWLDLVRGTPLGDNRESLLGPILNSQQVPVLREQYQYWEFSDSDGTARRESPEQIMGADVVDLRPGLSKEALVEYRKAWRKVLEKIESGAIDVSDGFPYIVPFLYRAGVLNFTNRRVEGNPTYVVEFQSQVTGWSEVSPKPRIGELKHGNHTVDGALARHALAIGTPPASFSTNELTPGWAGPKTPVPTYNGVPTMFNAVPSYLIGEEPVKRNYAFGALQIYETWRHFKVGLPVGLKPAQFRLLVLTTRVSTGAVTRSISTVPVVQFLEDELLVIGPNTAGPLPTESYLYPGQESGRSTIAYRGLVGLGTVTGTYTEQGRTIAVVNIEVPIQGITARDYTTQFLKETVDVNYPCYRDSSVTSSGTITQLRTVPGTTFIEVAISGTAPTAGQTLWFETNLQELGQRSLYSAQVYAGPKPPNAQQYENHPASYSGVVDLCPLHTAVRTYIPAANLPSFEPSNAPKRVERSVWDYTVRVKFTGTDTDVFWGIPWGLSDPCMVNYNPAAKHWSQPPVKLVVTESGVQLENVVDGFWDTDLEVTTYDTTYKVVTEILDLVDESPSLDITWIEQRLLRATIDVSPVRRTRNAPQLEWHDPWIALADGELSDRSKRLGVTTPIAAPFNNYISEDPIREGVGLTSTRLTWVPPPPTSPAGTRLYTGFIPTTAYGFRVDNDTTITGHGIGDITYKPDATIASAFVECDGYLAPTLPINNWIVYQSNTVKADMPVEPVKWYTRCGFVNTIAADVTNSDNFKSSSTPLPGLVAAFNQAVAAEVPVPILFPNGLQYGDNVVETGVFATAAFAGGTFRYAGNPLDFPAVPVLGNRSLIGASSSVMRVTASALLTGRLQNMVSGLVLSGTAPAVSVTSNVNRGSGYTACGPPGVPADTSSYVLSEPYITVSAGAALTSYTVFLPCQCCPMFMEFYYSTVVSAVKPTTWYFLCDDASKYVGMFNYRYNRTGGASAGFYGGFYYPTTPGGNAGIVGGSASNFERIGIYEQYFESLSFSGGAGLSSVEYKVNLPGVSASASAPQPPGGFSSASASQYASVAVGSRHSAGASTKKPYARLAIDFGSKPLMSMFAANVAYKDVRRGPPIPGADEEVSVQYFTNMLDAYDLFLPDEEDGNWCSNLPYDIVLGWAKPLFLGRVLSPLAQIQYNPGFAYVVRAGQSVQFRHGAGSIISQRSRILGAVDDYKAPLGHDTVTLYADGVAAPVNVIGIPASRSWVLVRTTARFAMPGYAVGIADSYLSTYENTNVVPPFDFFGVKIDKLRCRASDGIREALRDPVQKIYGVVGTRTGNFVYYGIATPGSVAEVSLDAVVFRDNVQVALLPINLRTEAVEFKTTFGTVKVSIGANSSSQFGTLYTTAPVRVAISGPFDAAGFKIALRDPELGTLLLV